MQNCEYIVTSKATYQQIPGIDPGELKAQVPHRHRKLTDRMPRGHCNESFKQAALTLLIDQENYSLIQFSYPICTTHDLSHHIIIFCYEGGVGTSGTDYIIGDLVAVRSTLRFVQTTLWFVQIKCIRTLMRIGWLRPNIGPSINLNQNQFIHSFICCCDWWVWHFNSRAMLNSWRFERNK